MNRNILCFCIGVVLCVALPATALVSGTASTKATPIKTKRVEVTDYKSFKEYIANEEVSLARPHKGIQLNHDSVKFLNVKMELKKTAQGTNEEVAYLSADKTKVGVFNRRDTSFKIFDEAGKVLKNVILSQFPLMGVFAFSESVIFAISPSFDGPGGFEIFSPTGKFIKWVDSGDVEGYVISNKDKYFAVTTLDKDSAYFKIYDFDGNLLWEQAIVIGSKSVIQFSLDDRYAVVKLPKYWIRKSATPPYKSERRENKLYLIDVERKAIVSEEDYVD